MLGLGISPPYQPTNNALFSMRHHPFLATVLTLSLVGSAAAQADFTFAIDSNATNFVWSGTTSLGDIDEQPANFTMIGTSVLTMDTGGNPVGSAAFADDGDALISPNIHGVIPNPLPFLPPLATLDLSNAHVRITSPSFSVNNAGAFSTMVTINMLSGTLVIDDITGGHTVTDLTGMQSSPAAAGGTLTYSGGVYHLNVPVSGIFPFDDPASGVNGSLTLNGTLHANFNSDPPAAYCATNPNSSGFPADLIGNGSPSIGTEDLVLTCSSLPSNVFGLFFYGPNPANAPFGDGVRCVGGSLQRMSVMGTGPLGVVNRPIRQSSLPPHRQMSVGELRRFQFWFRDTAAGGAGFNTSNAVAVHFTP